MITSCFVILKRFSYISFHRNLCRFRKVYIPRFIFFCINFYCSIVSNATTLQLGICLCSIKSGNGEIAHIIWWFLISCKFTQKFSDHWSKFKSMTCKRIVSIIDFSEIQAELANLPFLSNLPNLPNASKINMPFIIKIKF